MKGKNVPRPVEKVDKNTVVRLVKLIFGQYKLLWGISFICILFATSVQILRSFFIEGLIDDYIEPLLLEDNPVFDELKKFLLIFALVCLFGILFNYIYQRLMVVISQGIIKKLRDNMFHHMQKLPIRYFDTHKHGDIMSYYTNDVDTLGQVISNSIPTIITSVLTVIMIVISMIIQSALLTLFTIIGVALMLLLTKSAAKKSSNYFGAQQEAKGKLNGYVEEMIEGQKVVKVFTHEDKAKSDFDKINEELCLNSYNAESHANVIGPISNNVGHFIYVVIAIIGGALTVKGKMSIGVLAAFLQLVRTFTMPVTQVTQQIGVVFQALAGSKRIFSLLDEENEIDEGNVTLVELETNKWAWKVPNGDDFEYVPFLGDVRLNGVNFGYNKKKQVLYDIKLYAKPGHKIAFVGATGAGKTTIINLLTRFYDVSDGTITYDGIDINDIKKDDLRMSLGMVLQDTNLFTGTIRENIAYGKPNATFEEIKEAAKLANADEFIEMLPKGYDTEISGNSAEISQGQKQLLSIARVALVNPPVMILDEATSSIDSRTESIVQSGMDSLMKGRTVFVIAHRLSTVKNSNAIMVLEHGHIIERGTHEELIKEKGVYYKLYTGAFELQ